jgi:TatD DNase family protein
MCIRDSRNLARDHRGFIYHTIGLHPCSVDERWSEAVAEMDTFWENVPHPPVALGECGLDCFHLPKDDPAAAEKIFRWQRGAFSAQLLLARRLGCPIVVHSRGAFTECVEMIDRSGIDWRKVIFHCFTESALEMAELTKRGAFGSFTGILTYKSADAIRSAALAQGIHRLMLETDAPYLTPMPHRGKPNEPAFLRHTAEFAANLFKRPYAELAATTTTNARRFFGL